MGEKRKKQINKKKKKGNKSGPQRGPFGPWHSRSDRWIERATFSWRSSFGQGLRVLGMRNRGHNAFFRVDCNVGSGSRMAFTRFICRTWLRLHRHCSFHKIERSLWSIGSSSIVVVVYYCQLLTRPCLTPHSTSYTFRFFLNFFPFFPSFSLSWVGKTPTLRWGQSHSHSRSFSFPFPCLSCLFFFFLVLRVRSFFTIVLRVPHEVALISPSSSYCTVHHIGECCFTFIWYSIIWYKYLHWPICFDSNCGIDRLKSDDILYIGKLTIMLVRYPIYLFATKADRWPHAR